MKTLLALLIGLFLSPMSFGQTYTAVTATGYTVDNGSGTAINPPSGSNLCFLGVNNVGAAITYTPAGGAPVSGPVCQTFDGSGNLTGSLQVANPATASPVGLRYTITISHTSTTYLTIPQVQVSGALFQLSNFALPVNGSALGIGYPHLACVAGAQWASTTLPSGSDAETCQLVSGIGTWRGYPNGAYCPAGLAYQTPQISGTNFCLAPVISQNGAPSGTCTKTSFYFQQDAPGTIYGCYSGAWSLISGSGSAGLTSFQGRTTAAATLINTDVEGILANSPYNLNGSRSLLYDSASGTFNDNVYWVVNSGSQNGEITGIKNFNMAPGLSSPATVVINASTGAVNFANGNFSSDSAGATAWGGGSSIASSNNVCLTSGANCPSSSTPFYQLAQNNGTSVTQRGKLNFIPLSGIIATDNSGNGSTDISLAAIPNSSLTNSSITVNTGSGLSGGGVVALGSSLTISESGSSGAYVKTAPTANQSVTSPTGVGLDLTFSNKNLTVESTVTNPVNITGSNTTSTSYDLTNTTSGKDWGLSVSGSANTRSPSGALALTDNTDGLVPMYLTPTSTVSTVPFSAPSIADTSLTLGDCVQSGAGGLLGSIPCGNIYAPFPDLTNGIEMFGDSHGASVGVVNQFNGFEYIASASIGGSNTNLSVGGSQFADGVTAQYFGSGYVTPTSNAPLALEDFGTNEVIWCFNVSGNSAGCAQNALNAQMTLDTWPITTNKVLGNTWTTSAGTWSSDTRLPSAALMSTTNGSALTVDFTQAPNTRATCISWEALANPNGGAASLVIDGTSYGTLNAFGSSGQTVTTGFIGSTWTVWTSCIPLNPATHHIVVTVTSATGSGNIFSLVGAISPSDPSVRTYGSPRMVSAGVIRQQADGQSAQTLLYNTQKQQVVTALQSYGFPVVFADVRGTVDATYDMSSTTMVKPNGTTCIASTQPPYHMNVCGHIDYATAIFNAAGYTPGTNVLNQPFPISVLTATPTSATEGYSAFTTGVTPSCTNLNGGINFYPYNGQDLGADLACVGSVFGPRIFMSANQSFFVSTHANGVSPTTQSSYTTIFNLNPSVFNISPGMLMNTTNGSVPTLTTTPVVGEIQATNPGSPDAGCSIFSGGGGSNVSAKMSFAACGLGSSYFKWLTGNTVLATMDHTGNMTISGSFSVSSPSSSSISPINAFAPSLSTGNSVIQEFGLAANSVNNTGLLGFTNSGGTGSSSNSVVLGVYGSSGITLTGTGAASIPGSLSVAGSPVCTNATGCAGISSYGSVTFPGVSLSLANGTCQAGGVSSIPFISAASTINFTLQIPDADTPGAGLLTSVTYRSTSNTAAWSICNLTGGPFSTTSAGLVFSQTR